MSKILKHYIHNVTSHCPFKDFFTYIVLFDYHRGSVRTGSTDAIYLSFKGKGTEAWMC